MKKIFKYPLEFHAGSMLAMPQGAKILCVQVQRGQPCVWAEVDPTQPPEPRTLAIFGTGHEIPENVPLKYLGTFQVEGGSLVFHLYELVRVKTHELGVSP